MRVVLSVNQEENSLLVLSQALQTGASRGIFFVLDELDPNPVSIDDVKSGGDTFSTPDPANSPVGFDPLQERFSLSTSSLLSNSFYRVKMVALDASGNVTHTGTGDCPINLSLSTQNEIRICFGINNVSNPPLCPALTTFSDCPGI